MFNKKNKQVEELLEAEVPFVEEVVADKEDRSAFNCDGCKGEGIDESEKVCAKCSGTGKI